MTFTDDLQGTFYLTEFGAPGYESGTFLLTN